MELKEYFKVNKAEHRLFRIVKPFGWALFIFFLVLTILSATFFFLILFKEFEQYKPYVITNSNLQYKGIADAFRMSIQNKIIALDYCLFFFVISAFCLVLTRINTKLWMILRYFAMYNSLSYIYHNNKNKLVISTISSILGIIGFSFIFLFTFYNMGWFNSIVKSINTEYNLLYHNLENVQYINSANNLIVDFRQKIDKMFMNINIQNFCNEMKTYIIIGISGCFLLILTNFMYGCSVLFYQPEEKEIDFSNDNWNYLSLVDEKFIKDKKLKVGNPMSYSNYESFLTNGYSGKRGNLRDKQFDIYQQRSREREM